ncbi:helix-turn-helix domain-containing protein [Tetragenococcus koreensis]|uniref:PucR family transcriptional regulator n=1 Tax=Tetragenococcus koreensis TaxID=290335 RepID=A0AAN4UC28_9ENTE|nr:helix-turn-helix domain-containing protein [Tetragenococcus koreensis]MCF1585901.1 helix-turn-helix domain-containing protein [Tetragenococcus koreensis]MCF1615467.1 helix-turn-helix domain-containing protein [Tetragenococcus koreensis]MCF1616928.1 helix-turn-helix domain-containing protein [Tetragenococcus koreensis]MCF1620499.1 helix-turn-helix domain-containing protein [Tetragenococcus koreensis]MCF1621825.1 helix-turn-helix domain-containing protein [Tetragenococcus koreensis]
MKQQKLQEIYPTSSIHAFPTVDTDYLSIAVAHGFLWIPQKNLSPTEKKLLQAIAITNPATIPTAGKERPWYAALFSDTSAPADEGAFRLIQIKCHALEKNDLAALHEEMSTILPHTVDLFFLSESYGIIVESFSEDALTTEELEGLFLALDSDFNSYTRLFSGAFHSFEANFTQLLFEEEQLFLYLLEHDTQTKSFDMGTAIIPFFAIHDVTKSYLMRTLFAEWFDAELEQIICTLWQTQGNISSAAKELFMHRNTLQYKVDKFQQRSNTNLKKMDDLFLCYLLVLSCELLAT